MSCIQWMSKPEYGILYGEKLLHVVVGNTPQYVDQSRGFNWVQGKIEEEEEEEN